MAEEIQIARLLVKTEQKLPRERSAVAHKAAFSTARDVAGNQEQKAAIRGWKEGNGGR